MSKAAGFRAAFQVLNVRFCLGAVRDAGWSQSEHSEPCSVKTHVESGRRKTQTNVARAIFGGEKGPTISWRT